MRMGRAAGLRKHLDGKDGNRHSKALRGCLEGGKATRAPGQKLVLKKRQRGPIDHRRKGLGESVGRGERDSSTGDLRVMEQISDQRRRDERQVNRQKSSPEKCSGRKACADTRQRPETGLAVFK